MADFPHKRGDTFKVSAQCTELPGRTPIDITDWDILSQIRTAKDELIAEFDVTITDASEGQYELFCEDTTEWPVGKAYWDIQYTDAGGTIRSTETITVAVIKDISKLEVEPTP